MHTLRTSLRRLNESDLDNMICLESNPEIVRFTRIRTPRTPEQTRQRLMDHLSKPVPTDHSGVWVAHSKESGDFLGWFMLIPDAESSAELGYMIVQDFWGRGLATEVCAHLITIAWSELNLKKIMAITDDDNWASMKILGKLNFEKKRHDFQTRGIVFELQNPKIT